MPNFYKKKGEGIHHIDLTVAYIDAEIARLKSEGFELINDQPKQRADHKRIVFFASKDYPWRFD